MMQAKHAHVLYFFAGLTATLATCALPCGCVATCPPSQEERSLVLINGVYEQDGAAFRGGKSEQIQFWTPSTATWAAVVAGYGDEGDVPAEDHWQRVTQKQIDDFGRDLRASGLVGGWRYHDVYGYGEFTRKPGLWWTATTRDGVDAEALGAFYLKAWPGADRVYIEMWMKTQ